MGWVGDAETAVQAGTAPTGNEAASTIVNAVASKTAAAVAAEAVDPLGGAAVEIFVAGQLEGDVAGAWDPCFDPCQEYADQHFCSP